MNVEIKTYHKEMKPSRSFSIFHSQFLPLFFWSWINAANAMPKRCHSAHDKNEQRTREIEDKIIHIARARAGVHLQHFHRRDAQRERRREKENASLPAEQCGQKYAHRRKRD